MRFSQKRFLIFSESPAVSRSSSFRYRSSRTRNAYSGRYCAHTVVKLVPKKVMNGTQTYLRRIVTECPWTALYCSPQVRYYSLLSLLLLLLCHLASKMGVIFLNRPLFWIGSASERQASPTPKNCPWPGTKVVNREFFAKKL